ncbi:DUF1569 domain-containing protein [Ferruginibacter yonginensis]|uniref:DUF1569 domain-containing protein n=1 Tax=Ferruginibacter yonginensis TaxID=1310416 RepID=A0ABV8QSV9_9BACT
MQQNEHLHFLTEALHTHLQTLEATTKPQWGVMNAQEMIEHLNDFFQMSINNQPASLLTPTEDLPKYHAFLMSDKMFRENTKAPAALLGDTPIPIRHNNISEAVQTLLHSIQQFIAYFNTNQQQRTIHPIFGSLNFDEWTRLHYKHVHHHLKQFALI